MNLINAGLQTVATGLVATGATIFSSNMIGGTVAILLGIAVYVVYEITPVKPSA